MAGVNNYTLGRGKLHFAQFRPGTQTPGGEKYFGNTPELNFSAEQENLDHYSSDEGVRKKDASVLLQLDYSGTFQTDNISPQNMAYWYLGESLTKTVAAATVASEIHALVEQGATYQLGTSAANPAGVRKVASVVVKSTGGTPTTYAAGVDYVVDETLARVTIIEGGAITNLSSIDVAYSIEAHSINQVISKAKTIEGAARYIAANPEGDQIDYFLPWVKLTPNGDFALKGDEWQVLPFNIEILQKGALESIYANGRPFTPTAI